MTELKTCPKCEKRFLPSEFEGEWCHWCVRRDELEAWLRWREQREPKMIAWEELQQWLAMHVGGAEAEECKTIVLRIIAETGGRIIVPVPGGATMIGGGGSGGKD